MNNPQNRMPFHCILKKICTFAAELVSDVLSAHPD